MMREIMRGWRDISREALLILTAGSALGLVANAVRADGLVLGRVPPRAVEEECAPPTDQTQWISEAEAVELVGHDEVLFIDARPTADFQRAHVAGALSIPFEAGQHVPPRSLEAALHARTVITYCDTHGGCGASVALARALAAAGAGDVRVLEGGWPAWEQAAAPAEAGSCRLCPDG